MLLLHQVQIPSRQIFRNTATQMTNPFSQNQQQLESFSSKCTEHSVDFENKEQKMCKMGCIANRFCGILIGLLNTAMMIGYYMGVVILESQCKEACYEAITLLVGVLAGPLLLYFVGYFLAWLAYKKGQGTSTGCNFCCVV